MSSSPHPSLLQVLTDEQRDLLTEERRLLTDLQAALARFAASPEDEAVLRRALHQLDELFLLVVAGEFNAGKSAVINALVGERVLAEGVTPTTSRIHLLKHRKNLTGREDTETVELTVSDSPVLTHVDIVDTPGTNAIDREHEAITREFIPRSDLVLFVTSADRPFTESERTFLEAIRDWGKKIVLVINKIDIILQEEDIARIESFVGDSAAKLLDTAPAIFPVSARQALAAKQSGEGAATPPRFAALESFIVSTLDETERVRLKLLSPLGIGLRLVGEHLAEVGRREELLKDDFEALTDIEGQLAVYREDMSRQFRFRLADIENILHEFEASGREFFEETVRLGRVFDLVNRSKVKNEFERKVVADMPQRVERKVGEIIDWLVAQELAQWQAVEAHVARRKSEHSDRIVGAEKRFDYDRARLLETVGRASREAVDRYDRRREADRMAESVQRAVAGTAALEVGALGLGAVVASVTMSTMADVTGILAAGALAALGLFILPARRRAAQEELRAKIAEIRERLLTSLTAQFEREIEGSVERIKEAVAPYTRFIRAERERLAETRDELDGIRRGLGALRERIAALG